MTLRAPDFEREGRSWPLRDRSRFVEVDGARVHAQVTGEIGGGRPVILLVHGTGAGVHSFRDLVPLLSQRFVVVAVDLPGQGFSTFTSPARSPSPSGMAAVVRDVCAALDVAPAVVVGHSAGAAVVACFVIDAADAADDADAVALFVGCGAALVPLSGVAAVVLPLTARLFARAPLAARFVAWQARQPGSVERLVRSTGSRIDAAGIDLYRRLAGCSGHVAGVLRMLSRWDLTPVFDRLALIEVPALFIAGVDDRAVPVDDQRRGSERIAGARLVVVDDAGHLVHEERPAEVARLIHEAATAAGIAGPAAAPSLNRESP